MISMILLVPFYPVEEEEQEVGHVGEENVVMLMLLELYQGEVGVEVEEGDDHLQKHSKQPVIPHQRVLVIQEIVGKVVVLTKVIILVLVTIFHSHWTQ